MLEFYCAYSDYWDLMDFTEAMLARVAERTVGTLQVPYGEDVIDFGACSRLTMREAVRKYWTAGEPPDDEQLTDRGRLAELLSGLETPFDQSADWGKLLGQLFDTVAEERLVQPTIVYDYPVELSPLSKTKDEDPRFVERFELYIAGFEVANAYSELNDPEEQRARFAEQLKERARGDLEAHEMDEDYVRALRYGMPPTAGEGVGVDRLTMVLTGRKSIREVILFPQLRPEGGE